MEISRELALWSHRLLGIAQTGLAFATSPYDVERYRDLLLLAAEMAAASNARAYLDEQLADQWLTEDTWAATGFGGTLGRCVATDLRCTAGSVFPTSSAPSICR